MSIINRPINSYDLPNSKWADIEILQDPLLTKAQVTVDVLRLDKIHTIISGNKWFKLKYYLAEVIRQGKKGIITFGGAYSNHLLATAFACAQAGLSSIGVVRGEEPAEYSHTLKDAQTFNMQIQFVSRPQYKDNEFADQVRQSHPDFLFVAEGGRGQLGIKGAEEILHLLPVNQYTHIICAVGTGTMMTGLINSSDPEQLIIGIPVIKLGESNSNSIYEFINHNSSSKNFALQYDYHFGGYAKKNTELIRFMNQFYDRHTIPSDFVYTGKLFYASIKLIESNFFNAWSKIMLVLSGGLQGNRSLPGGLLNFS